MPKLPLGIGKGMHVGLRQHQPLNWFTFLWWIPSWFRCRLLTT